MWQLFILVFSFQLSLFPPFLQASWQTKVDPEVMDAFEFQKEQEFIILLKEQADLSYANQLQLKELKNRYVFEQLYFTAEKMQQGLRQMLQQSKAPVQSLYIVNAIKSTGDLALVRKIALRAEVASIIPNPQIAFEPAFQERESLNLRSQTIEWGLEKIRAPEVWEMGIRGQGIVVGGQDTGYDWEHPAIINQYRGNQGETVDHNYNWHDAIREFNPLNPDTISRCGLDINIPCDDNSHGTHTMGIMVGDDGQGNQIGVAPEAQWVGVRNMERGYGNPFSYTESFQWFLAPTDTNGLNPNPDMAPDAIANSWYCPELEGCNSSNRGMLEMAVNNLKAAGIIVVVSAGNAGNQCNTINEIPSSFVNAFAVGATDINDDIAFFSSRGPIYDLDSNRIIKPDISAPGVNVRSAVLDGNYTNYSGTSMAGPHVTGAIALLLSAQPGLRGQVDSVLNILKRTARPILSTQDCDSLIIDTIPNAVFGYGILDIKAAVDEALSVVTNTQEEISAQTLNVFPNPSQEQFFFKLPEGFRGGDMQIMDINGKVLFQKRILPQSSTAQLNLSNYPKGVYFYQLVEQSKHYSGKLVKR